MKTVNDRTPTKSIGEYVEMFRGAARGYPGAAIHAYQAAAVGTTRGLLRHAQGLSDRELLDELRRVASALELLEFEYED